MAKGLLFLLLIFISLVALNWLFTSASSLFPAYSSGVLSNNLNTGYYGGVTKLNFDLFSQNGEGVSYMTQGYGKTPYSSIYPDDWHDGIDIAASYGTPIYSPNAGTVFATGNQDNFCYHKAFGKYVAVKDPATNLILWYAHLGTLDVSPGQTIAKGAEIGTVGATGLETGTHLHFSIFEATGFTMTPRDGCGPEPTGQDIDPLNYLGTTYE